MKLRPSFALAAVLFILAAAFVPGCGESAEQLFETAKLEELQHNPQHAMELYERILARHPESEYAAPARERLEALRQEAHRP